MMRTIKMKNKWAVALLFVFMFASIAEANIVVRAAVVNTTSQKRKIPFKSYLPREVKPENVVDMGDLEIAYDPKEGAYYVYKDYELEPKESVLIEIDMEDVWKIPQDEIKSLREESGKVTKILVNTDYYERATYLKNSIESKLNQIEQSQRVISPNPGGYISDYRDNLKLVEAVKSDLAAAKTLMAEAKNIAPLLTWKLIIAIVVFLGFLGMVFFIVWQRQIKHLAELTEDYGGTPESSKPEGSPEEGERRQAQEEKKSGISDIEKRLKGE
jgi:hypothetical protein